MNQLNWLQAPQWANCFVINSNGIGFFTENPPYLATWREPKGWVISSDGGRIRFAGGFKVRNWMGSKQYRPSEVQNVQ